MSERKNISNETPELQPPGAGLPFHELVVLRILFRLKRLRFDRSQLAQLFRQEQEEILGLANKCSPQDGVRPVLIDRMRGIEDSSRCWSVYMTIEHLVIVNKSISQIVASLVAGRVPKKAVRIADVKPSIDANESVMELFASGCESYLQAVEIPDSLKTQHKYSHPWIGQMNALDWHALGARHMGIHRQQIEKILAG